MSLTLNQTQVVEEDFSDLFIDEIQNETEIYYNVLNLAKAIANSEHPEAVIAAFDRDPNFHEAFNSNGKNALENITEYLDASNEGLGTDFFKWSLPGLIAGAYYQSFSRIKKVCTNYSATDKTLKRTSLYLPNKDIFFKCVDAAQKLFNVVSAFNKKPDMPFDQIIQVLEKSGIKCPKGKAEKMIGVDWAQIISISVTRWITAGVANVAAQVGNRVVSSLASGASGYAQFIGRIFSRNAGPVGKRGWTVESLNQAKEKVVEMIDQIELLKKNKGQINKDSKDLKAKVRLYKSVIDVYANLLKEAGRGVASALSLIQ